MSIKLFTTKDVAELTGIHRDTLLRWLRDGKIKEPNRDRNGWRIFTEKEIEKIKEYKSTSYNQISVAFKNTPSYNVNHNESIENLLNIDWNFDDVKTDYLTHSLHPYPAKYIPQIPKSIIRELASAGDTILDPFCGSGTTLVESLRLECNAVGFDANPLSTLISRAKTHIITEDEAQELYKLSDYFGSLSENPLSNNLTLFTNTKIPQIKDHDLIGIDGWFYPHVINELVSIREHSKKLKNLKLQDIALVSFSSIIVNVSKQDSDTRYVRREKDIKLGDTFKLFSRKLRKNAQKCFELGEELTPKYKAHIFTRNILNPIIIDPVDLVVCSPPYPNAFSYHLYHRTRMLWLGMDQSLFKKEEIGSHRKYSSKSKNAATVETYKSEFTSIFRWLHEILKKDKYACFVIGDSTIRGDLVKNDQLLIEIAKNTGFKIEANIQRNIKKTKKSFNPSHGKIKEERILIIRKEA